MCLTGRVRGSQPARRSGRSVKKSMNNNIYVMYIWCSAVVLFTCTLVLSRQSARKELSAKYELLEQTARYWVGQRKQEYTWGKRRSKRHSLTLDRGHEGRIREVLQEDGHSRMYRTIIVWLPVRNLPWLSPICCLCVTMIILYPQTELQWWLMFIFTD